jgi:hypothetical protein
MSKNQMLLERIQRHDGQVLNCAYGHWWPLSQHTDGFVKIKVRRKRDGVRLTYRWAATRAELVSVSTWIERVAAATRRLRAVRS